MSKGYIESLINAMIVFTIAWIIIPSSSCTSDTIIIDPVDTTGATCDSDTVYFEMQILPMLKGNCSIVGCHDAVTARNGVILDSYENLIATTVVTPNDLEGTEIYNRITEDDPAKRMPRFPRDPLDSNQLSLISNWILQGAENLDCDADTICDVAAVSYSMDIAPLIKRSCKGCHSGINPIAGFSLDTYEQVEEKAISGMLYGAMAWEQGFVPMPLSQGQLPECDIDIIKAWVDDGAPNN